VIGPSDPTRCDLRPCEYAVLPSREFPGKLNELNPLPEDWDNPVGSSITQAKIDVITRLLENSTLANDFDVKLTLDGRNLIFQTDRPFMGFNFMVEITAWWEEEAWKPT
jgi:hypothetical protein